MATLFSSVLCLLSLFQLTVGNGCQSTNDPCKASCGGKAVDLSNVLAFPFKMENIADEQGNIYNYSINLCKGVECNSDNPAAICQTSIHKKDFNLGSVNHFNWSLVSTKPLTAILSFPDGLTHGDGTNRQSQITVVENSHTTQITYLREANNIYYFKLQVKTSSGNIVGAIGLTLILLAMVALIIYFIVGALIMYFVKGARGVEIIPNLGFWKALPFLIKDGCLFTISPCYKRGSYEKI